MQNQALPLAAQRIFDSLKTKNFETVLTVLATTQTVDLALRIPRSSVIGTYHSVRNSLVHAVRSVHVPWCVALEPSLRVLRDEFRHYQTVFTTNYDLLAYWAIMLGGPRGDFSDYFLYGSFTPDQVIFGQSLDPTFDRHIIDAVNESASPLVAISIRPGPRATLQVRQRELLNRLTKPLAFFDSSSHPLGNPEIEVGAP